MNGLSVAAIALIAFMMPTLMASLGSLEAEGKNNALPMLWILLGIGWIVWLSVGTTLNVIGADG